MKLMQQKEKVQRVEIIKKNSELARLANDSIEDIVDSIIDIKIDILKNKIHQLYDSEIAHIDAIAEIELCEQTIFLLKRKYSKTYLESKKNKDIQIN